MPVIAALDQPGHGHGRFFPSVSSNIKDKCS